LTTLVYIGVFAGLACFHLEAIGRESCRMMITIFGKPSMLWPGSVKMLHLLRSGLVGPASIESSPGLVGASPRGSTTGTVEQAVSFGGVLPQRRNSQVHVFTNATSDGHTDP
jgi:hypothetical protein